MRSSSLPGRSRHVITAIEATIAVNAIGGMVYGLAGAPAVPADWLEDSPFASYRLPALYLGTVVGGSSVLAALAAARDEPYQQTAAAVSSAVTLTWIAAQVRIIGYRSMLQPAVALAGLAVGRLALKGPT